MKKSKLYAFAVAACMLVPFNAFAIFGGQNVDSKDYKKSPVVALMHSESSSEPGLICTATLLNSRTLLTAAHCVQDSYNTIHRNVSPNRRGGGMHISRSQIHQHPEYQVKNHVNDFAIIKLNSDLRDIGEVVYPELSEITEHEIYKIFGYGEDIRQSDGVLRTITKIKADSKVLPPDEPNRDNYLEFDQSNGTGICSGDSGGPVLAEVNGKSVIIAINTSATNKQNLRKCSNSGIVTKVSTVMEWIKSYL